MPAAYATFAQFQTHWGSRRTAQLADKLDASSLQGMVKTGLSGGAAMMDTAGIEGGYNVPMSGADLFPSDATMDQRVDDLLTLKNIVISSAFLIQVIDDTEKLKATKAECTAWLEALAAGGGLPKAPPSRTDSALVWISQTGASKRFRPLEIQRARSANP